MGNNFLFLFIIQLKTTQICAISPLIWAGIVFSCAVPAWKMSPSPDSTHRVFLGFPCCSASPQMEGGQLCTAVHSARVGTVLLGTWDHTNAQEPWVHIWWDLPVFDGICPFHSPGGGLGSDALQPVCAPWQMLQPVMLFRPVAPLNSSAALFLMSILHLTLQCSQPGCSSAWYLQQPRSGSLEQVHLLLLPCQQFTFIHSNNFISNCFLFLPDCWWHVALMCAENRHLVNGCVRWVSSATSSFGSAHTEDTNCSTQLIFLIRMPCRT